MGGRRQWTLQRRIMVTPKTNVGIQDIASACFCLSRRCASPTDLRGVEAPAAQHHQRSLGIFFTKFLFLFPLQFFTIY
ncbi:hypothetical protein CTAM01_06328 [Colletotrichum tamarilloi]|uniref:Uncharacterized protein n=1 Tax=Colletotrichum tamarilloi TaxID=1209934 RepID=A0ABQ9RCX3_9PEZI|nr:uncharacterized protein CTAM01_06328 [Colletotrichum tamarilloi]KAK1500876.1 hypothetical protein CTAM01_06328 [Colletotrichum tamarilloi]